VVQARLTQLAVLVVGLFLFGPWLGIAGVALVVNVMLLVGITIMLWLVRTHVDFSIAKLFFTPGLALVLGLLLGRGVLELPGVVGAYWRMGLSKAVVFSIAYGAVWLAIERSQISDMFQILRSRLPKSNKQTFDTLAQRDN
jgi:hypothetical protein